MTDLKRKNIRLALFLGAAFLISTPLQPILTALLADIGGVISGTVKYIFILLCVRAVFPRKLDRTQKFKLFGLFVAFYVTESVLAVLLGAISPIAYTVVSPIVLAAYVYISVKSVGGCKLAFDRMHSISAGVLFVAYVVVSVLDYAAYLEYLAGDVFLLGLMDTPMTVWTVLSSVSYYALAFLIFFSVKDEKKKI